MKKTTIAFLFLLSLSLFIACSADVVSGDYNNSGIVNESGYVSSSSADSDDSSEDSEE
ncbi:hypothetical protein [uncultured Fibrobacter sp.]|uniref:hypothetical protein n=1 Tax=uncultured Fibrobacter sp. TaxID=261512 RepID=UPI002803F242|nr:hypothetical protein [uncultured Fibrobacter sp.]